ncbi:hypothetical protein JK628_11820 [Shewanella sp. KX20019]|uniref:hypothetical protein n=1 Tax=Shewanella sp. KX20019 TaxID=2803864 RepID=UPI001926FB32|nr:hypothetical protein [Shewanella sp. KX20019]QQX78303.1 hypothetical protein JK628_11820 [Shewanella sp. KX20019]
MKRIQTNQGFYGDRISVLEDYLIEEIHNPSSKQSAINSKIIEQTQRLVLDIYSKDQLHRETLSETIFSKSHLYRSVINVDHLWLVYKEQQLCAYVSGKHIYTASGEQLYLFSSSMIASELKNKRKLFSVLNARQIICSVLSFWNKSENLGKPMPFITRTLNPIVAQTVYQFGSNMYPDLNGVPITEVARNRYNAFEDVIHEVINDEGILKNSFMKHTDYVLKNAKGRSARSKIYEFCRQLGDSNGAALTGELNFEQELINYLRAKSAHDERSLNDVNLIELLRDNSNHLCVNRPLITRAAGVQQHILGAQDYA